MRMALLSFAVLALTPLICAAQTSERGKQEEQHSCVQCHSLRLVESQRLSRTAWEKEVDKMMRWGAPVTDRRLLIDYLATEYSDSKPMAPDEYTADGSNAKNRKER